MSLSQLESIFSHPLFIFKRVNSLLSQTIHSTSIMSFKQLRFKKLSNDAYAPTKGSKYAAGYDLYAAHDGVVPARGKELIKTDIAVAIPSGCYGRVAPRSGLAWKHSIDVGAGVIDQDYRGNVGVILFNLGENDFQVNKGDRIAQLICEQIADTELVETEDLDQTNRGENGFGSTGVSVDKKIKSEC